MSVNPLELLSPSVIETTDLRTKCYVEVESRDRDKGVISIIVAGEWDIATRDMFELCLRQAIEGFHHVVIDMQDLKFMGAEGYEFLNRESKRVCGPSGEPRFSVYADNMVVRLLQILDPFGRVATILPLNPSTIN